MCVCVCNECLIIYWLLTFLNDPYLKRCLFNGNSWKDVSLNCYTYPTARWIEPSQIVQYLSFEYTLFNLIAFLCVSVAHPYNLFKMHTHTKGNYNWTKQYNKNKKFRFPAAKNLSTDESQADVLSWLITIGFSGRRRFSKQNTIWKIVFWKY